MASVKDLLQNAISDNAVGFAEIFSQIMDEKIPEAIEAKRIEIAQSIYGSPSVNEDVEVNESDEEIETDDDDFDDDDQLDLDLDLDDLDDEDLGEE